MLSTEFTLGPTTNATLGAIILDNSTEIPKFGNSADVEGKASIPKPQCKTLHSFLDMKVNINIGMILVSLDPKSTGHPTSLLVVLGRVLVLGGQD